MLWQMKREVKEGTLTKSFPGYHLIDLPGVDEERDQIEGAENCVENGVNR
jgi:hypothetical protein